MPRAPASMDTGIISVVGWINLTTLLLRRFASFRRAALHASVTRRATSYGLDPQLVSIQPGGRRLPTPIRVHLKYLLRAGPSPRTEAEAVGKAGRPGLSGTAGAVPVQRKGSSLLSDPLPQSGTQ